MRRLGLIAAAITYTVPESAIGQLVAVIDPANTQREFRYDGEGNLILTTDGQQEVAYEYTSQGSLSRRRQAGTAVQFHYDLEGRLTGLDNENAEPYRFELDALGQVITEQGFDGLTRRYERDAAGRVTHIVRPAGRHTSYAYTPAGQLAEVAYNDEAPITYTYGPGGALHVASTATTTVAFERDALGRVVQETQNTHTVSSIYNVLEQRVGLHSSLGADLRLERDQAGDVTQMRADTWSSRIERDARGLELHRTFSGGLTTSWQRDALGRPISQRISVGRDLRAGAQPLRQRRYEWQGADQLRVLEDDLVGGTQFTYSSVGYLSGAQYTDGPADLRRVDAVGNLFRTDDKTDRMYGKGGQLRAANGTRYKYDEEGNLIRKTLPDGQAWHYTWDGAGQLLRVKRPDGYAVTFAYDALGRRVSKRFRSQVTKWVWDGDKPLHEWTELEVGPSRDSAEDVVTWLFDEQSFAPTAKLTSGGHYSVVTDHLGTPLELYDAQGRNTWQAQLDAYGAVRQGLGKPQDCPFRYQGQYEDAETGLYYNRFRYYDPQAGSYISQDPIQLEGGLGLYSYVSNVTACIDPFGLSSCPPKRPGGHQTGDVSNHGGLSPGKNRATGHTNTRADNFVQSHYPIQNEWAKRNITGYDEYDAPATLLKSSSGSPHAKISALQRARRRLPDGWQGSLKDEFNTSYKEMIDAGVPKAQAQRALQKSYKYFDSIGAF